MYNAIAPESCFKIYKRIFSLLMNISLSLSFSFSVPQHLYFFRPWVFSLSSPSPSLSLPPLSLPLSPSVSPSVSPSP